jgi:hypothetical protein
MSEDFVLFQSFQDPAAAQDLIDQLRFNNIPFDIENSSPPIDPLFIGANLDPNIRIKLRPQDFAKAQAVLEKYYGSQLNNIGEDYYLFSFSNEELREILEKPDEWGYLDQQLAKKILKERGEELSAEKLALLKQERLRQVEQPEEAGTRWLVVGYLFSVVVPLVGVFFGSYLFSHKKTLPDGRRVYAYVPASRNHGFYMLIISIVRTVSWVVMRMMDPGHGFFIFRF